MGYQIDWDNIICVQKCIEPKRKEENQIFAMVRDMQMETHRRTDAPKIVAEDELKNIKWAIVEIKQQEPRMYEEPELLIHDRPLVMGLVDVKMDETRQEFSGTRVMMCVGRQPIYERVTFRMNKYRKFWRVWTLRPSESTIWDS